ncbi:Nn.00g110600.m01.CDS01 [Neocucurbitaria sp. VM-36]
MTATMTKVTSLGSPYSASGAPSVPNPTPATETLETPGNDSAPAMDFAAVAKILGPIQESLNESAEEAMYPSPPINTPEVLSPAPSVHRYQTRSRGFSLIGDRLAQMKIDSRKLSRRDVDVASSNRSVEPSIVEGEEGDVASTADMPNDSGKGKHGVGHGSMSFAPLVSSVGEDSVPIALGSPTVNPRIEEYLSFTSKDLPTKPPAPSFASALVENAPSSTKTVHDNESLDSLNSIKSEDVVTEKSNWGVELEESVDRACMRLEQLAWDEYVINPSKSVEEYYIARLQRLLGSDKRVIPVHIKKLVRNLKA